MYFYVRVLNANVNAGQSASPLDKMQVSIKNNLKWIFHMFMLWFWSNKKPSTMSTDCTRVQKWVLFVLDLNSSKRISCHNFLSKIEVNDFSTTIFRMHCDVNPYSSQKPVLSSWLKCALCLVSSIGCLNTLFQLNSPFHKWFKNITLKLNMPNLHQAPLKKCSIFRVVALGETV